MQAAIAEDVALGLGIAGEKLGFEIEIAEQAPDRWREARALRAGLEEEAVPAHGFDHAAGAITGFEHKRQYAGLLQTKRAGKAGDSGANDDDLFRVSHCRLSQSNGPGAAKVYAALGLLEIDV